MPKSKKTQKTQNWFSRLFIGNTKNNIPRNNTIAWVFLRNSNNTKNTAATKMISKNPIQFSL